MAATFPNVSMIVHRPRTRKGNIYLYPSKIELRSVFMCMEKSMHACMSGYKFRYGQPYLASFAPWGVWKLLMRCAVAVPLG